MGWNVEDKSGDYLAAGIASFGKSIGEGIQNRIKAGEEVEYLNAQLPGLRQYMTEEELDKFHSGSLGTKRAIVSQAETMRSRAWDEEDFDKRLAVMASRRAGSGSELTAEDLGSFGAEGTTRVVPVKDPETGQTISYDVLNTVTGKVRTVTPRGLDLQDIIAKQLMGSGEDAGSTMGTVPVQGASASGGMSKGGKAGTSKGGMGGGSGGQFVPGKVYRMKDGSTYRFRGDDPNRPTSWEKVR